MCSSDLEGKSPFVIDSKAPTIPLEQYAYNETRYRMLAQSDPARAEALMRIAQNDVQANWRRYQDMATALNEETSSAP